MLKKPLLLLIILFISSCDKLPSNTWTGNYGLKGIIRDSTSSNIISNLQIILYNSVIADTNTTATNGLYIVKIFITGTEDGPINKDLTNSFNLMITDVDGVNNGQYPVLITNVGPVYLDFNSFGFNYIRDMDFYIQTN